MNVQKMQNNEALAQQTILKDLVDALLFEDIGGLASKSEVVTHGDQLFIHYGTTESYLSIPVYMSGLNLFRYAPGAVLRRQHDQEKILYAVELWDQIVEMNPSEAETWEWRRFRQGLQDAIQQLTGQLKGMNLSDHPFIRAEQLASFKDRPFHPIAKEKRGFRVSDYEKYQSEFHQPIALNTVAVHKDFVLNGQKADAQRYQDYFGATLDPCKAELQESGLLETAYMIFPVHPWQYEHVLPVEFEAEIEAQQVVRLKHTFGRYLSSSSMRTLINLEQPFEHLKVPLSIQSLGALRLTPTRYMKNGEVAEQLLHTLIQQDERLKGHVWPCDETAWWSYLSADGDVFKDQLGHLTMQFRQYPEAIKKDVGQQLVSMAALAAHDDSLYRMILSQPHGSLTQAQITDLFEAITSSFLEMTCSFMKSGALPELHGQNVLIAFKDGKVSSFVLRDHDTVRIYPKWLKQQHIEVPQYTVRNDTPNTLINETLEDFFAYFQTLAVSVNLYAIIDALVQVFDIAEHDLMTILRNQLTYWVSTIEWLPEDKEKVEAILLEQQTWPFKRIILPLLLQKESGGGSMPSSLGRVPNPMMKHE